jgi:hypothetical protein
VVLGARYEVLAEKNKVPRVDSWFRGMKTWFRAEETWFSRVKTWFSGRETWFSGTKTWFSPPCTWVSQVADPSLDVEEKRDRLTQSGSESALSEEALAQRHAGSA